jgi:hypothetical protein
MGLAGVVGIRDVEEDKIAPISPINPFSEKLVDSLGVEICVSGVLRSNDLGYGDRAIRSMNESQIPPRALLISRGLK